MFGGVTGAAQIQEPSEMADKVEVSNNNQATTNMQDNTKAATNSIYWWGLLFGLYFVWDYIQGQKKVADVVKPSNVRANVHNLFISGMAAVIFINAFNVFFTKLAALKIPVLSKVSGALLPLFNL